nr:hypothetical protein [uncultured Porphyromonas sp.]
MWKALRVFLIGVVLTGSYYSFEFAFGSSIPNTKIQLAAIGFLWYLFDTFRARKGVPFSPILLGSAILALLYSIINLIAVDLNNTSDYSYANYLFSFFTWVFSAYPAVALIRLEHGKVSFRLLVLYLTGATLFQCISAILIDQNPSIDEFVSSIVAWDAKLTQESDRLNGFSTALDPAGARFALVIIMIMAAISVDKEIKERPGELYFLVLSIFLITALGSMVSRTTSTGTAVGLLILSLYSMGGASTETRRMGPIIAAFIGFAMIGFSVGAYLYNTDPYYYEIFRFAFEGFFNLAEKGEFTTTSSEILQTMWVWPKDNFSWIIGTGLYDNWVYGSDIGYCRLILYSGLTGFVVFALMFVFLAYRFMVKYPEYRLMFLAFGAMTFIIWIKVSTDILMIYSFFFWLTPEDEDYIHSHSIAPSVA